MRKRDLVELAREMRKNPTPSEDAFWQVVRGNRFCGVKFRRQQVIDRFIVDFFAPSHRLVVEIDGGAHRGREEHDAAREQFLEDSGLRILRFTASDVERRLDDVMGVVSRVLRERETDPGGLPPLRLPERGPGGEA